MEYTIAKSVGIQNLFIRKWKALKCIIKVTPWRALVDLPPCKGGGTKNFSQNNENMLYSPGYSVV